MTNSTLLWSFKNRPKVLCESIKTADATCPKSVAFMLVDGCSSSDSLKEIREFIGNIDRDIRLCESHSNTTWQQAINLGIILSDTDNCIITSSDCFFVGSGWCEAIEADLEKHDYVLADNHSLFGISKRLVARIGFLDELYGHGPHIDSDLMMRTREAGIHISNVGNRSWYRHYDPPEEEKQRREGFVEDRLPMNTFENERRFKSKWGNHWDGWEAAIKLGSQHMPHPPVHDTNIIRLKDETHPYPVIQQRYKEKYNV